MQTKKAGRGSRTSFYAQNCRRHRWSSTVWAQIPYQTWLLLATNNLYSNHTWYLRYLYTSARRRHMVLDALMRKCTFGMTLPNAEPTKDFFREIVTLFRIAHTHSVCLGDNHILLGTYYYASIKVLSKRQRAMSHNLKQYSGGLFQPMGLLKIEVFPPVLIEWCDAISLANELFTFGKRNLFLIL